MSIFWPRIGARARARVPDRREGAEVARASGPITTEGRRLMISKCGFCLMKLWVVMRASALEAQYASMEVLNGRVGLEFKSSSLVG